MPPRRGGARKTEFGHTFKSLVGGKCTIMGCQRGATVQCQEPTCEARLHRLCVIHQAEHDSLLAIRAVGANLPPDFEKNIDSFSADGGLNKIQKSRAVGSDVLDAATLLLQSLYELREAQE